MFCYCLVIIPVLRQYAPLLPRYWPSMPNYWVSIHRSRHLIGRNSCTPWRWIQHGLYDLIVISRKIQIAVKIAEQWIFLSEPRHFFSSGHTQKCKSVTRRITPYTKKVNVYTTFLKVIQNQWQKSEDRISSICPKTPFETWEKRGTSRDSFDRALRTLSHKPGLPCRGPLSIGASLLFWAS